MYLTSKNQEGFAMLFAVLVSSVLLAIGVSIFNLTVKELALSASGRESQFSFYAADTGAECALYWDFKGTDIFATSTDNRVSNPSNPDCVDSRAGGVVTTQYITINNYVTYPNYAVSRFGSGTNVPSGHTWAVTKFNLTIPNTDIQNNSAPYCASVTVIKDAMDGVVTTTIDSRGYNTCVTTDPGRVERALKVTY